MEGLGLPNEDRKKKRSVETLRRMDIIIVAWPSITGPRHTTPEYDTDHVHCCPDPPDGDGEVICHASDGMR